MNWKFVSQDDGRVIEWDGSYCVDPLGFHDLVSTESGKPITFPLSIRNATVRDSFNELSEAGGKARISATLQTPFTSDVIGLIPGGWLPSMLAVEQRSILIDRNIVGEVQKRFHRGGIKSLAPTDLIDFLIDRPLRVNPALFALEGNKRELLSPDEIAQQIDEACRKIATGAPGWTIHPQRESLLLGVQGIQRDIFESFDRDIRFLTTIAHLLVHTTPQRKRKGPWFRILREAERQNLPRNALVVIASLSALACGQKQNPAKGIIKPHPNYNRSRAYNALFDLISIELLTKGTITFPDLPLALLTKDRDLALFWIGLGVRKRLEMEGTDASVVGIDLSEHLFPNLTDEEYASLADR